MKWRQNGDTKRKGVNSELLTPCYPWWVRAELNRRHPDFQSIQEPLLIFSLVLSCSILLDKSPIQQDLFSPLLALVSPCLVHKNCTVFFISLSLRLKQPPTYILHCLIRFKRIFFYQSNDRLVIEIDHTFNYEPSVLS